MKFYFPIHIDGNNRGCEGIAKGTAVLLGRNNSELIGLCRDIPLDRKLGIDNYVTLVPYRRNTLANKVRNKIISIFRLDMPYKFVDVYKLFIDMMSADDVMISTGGDMMCYGDCEVNSTNNQATEKGCKTILWGCSMGPENLTPQKEETLQKFDLIYARESLSYDFFKSIGLTNVVCYPDPAFVLSPEVVELPEFMLNGKIIGINISNYTIKSDDFSSPFGIEFLKFSERLLDNSEYKILLIPHVLWKNQDDRILCNKMVESLNKYKDRIFVLDSNKYNYLQIRYIISKLYCFIGARTHAVISAYSTCIPTIALGYSIKARGIAADLGLSSNLVIDTRKESELSRINQSFNYLVSHYNDIKADLTRTIPDYCQRTFGIRDDIDKLLKK